MKHECHLIPEEEKKCIWMTTGLISYKLCALDYNCDECLFDQVMRNEMAVQNDRHVQQPLAASGPRQQEPASKARSALFYHPGHCWVSVENPDEARIGIDAVLMRLVSRIRTVALPQEGEVVTQGQCFAHIIQEKHILQLIAPLTGTIIHTNQRLKKDPQLPARSPWDEGWLIIIKPENLEHDLQTLLFGRKAQKWLREKEQVIVRAGAAMLNQNVGPLGPTLQDGGEQVAGFVDMLSSEQFDQIIESLSGTDGLPT